MSGRKTGATDEQIEEAAKHIYATFASDPDFDPPWDELGRHRQAYWKDEAEEWLSKVVPPNYRIVLVSS